MIPVALLKYLKKFKLPVLNHLTQKYLLQQRLLLVKYPNQK